MFQLKSDLEVLLIIDELKKKTIEELEEIILKSV